MNEACRYSRETLKGKTRRNHLRSDSAETERKETRKCPQDRIEKKRKPFILRWGGWDAQKPARFCYARRSSAESLRNSHRGCRRRFPSLFPRFVQQCIPLPPRFLKGDPPLKQHEARIFCFLSFSLAKDVGASSSSLFPFASPPPPPLRRVEREGGRRWKRGEI